MTSSRILVCAFHTPDYAETAAGLRQTLDQHDIDYHIEPTPAVPNWEAGTRRKPQFVLDCLKRFADRDILYLDADARVRKPLDELEKVSGDVALYFRSGIKGGRPRLQPFAGTIFVRNNGEGLRFAEAWVEETARARSEDVDGDCLIRVIGRLAGLTITQLPQTYAWIFDRKDLAAPPVIEHLQASRGRKRLRKRGLLSILNFLPLPRSRA